MWIRGDARWQQKGSSRISGRCQRQLTISACPLPGRQQSVNRGSHRHNSEGRCTRNTRSYFLVSQNRVFPPTGHQRLVHIWDSDGFWRCLPTCPPTSCSPRQPPAPQPAGTAPPRHGYGIAPMWIAAHGSNTVALPDLPRNRAVAGRAVVLEVRRGTGGTDTRRRIIIGLPRKSVMNQ